MTWSRSLITPAVAALAFVALALLIACGDEDEDGASTPSPTATATETAAAPAEATATSAAADETPEPHTAYPLTITHRLGEAVIEAEPQRIVALGVSDQDALIALGITPVAVVRSPYTDSGFWPWQEAHLDASTTMVLDTTGGMPFEQIAGLNPDLILANPLRTIDEDYEKLALIAPTVADPDGILQDTWQERLAVVAAAVNRTAEAEKVEGDLATLVADKRAEFPQLEGQTYSLSWGRADTIVTMSARDTAWEFFTDLGFVLKPEVEELPKRGSGSALSMEQIGVLDADVMVVSYDPGVQETTEASPLFATLEAPAADRYQVVPLVVISALRVPTPVGIPWLLAELEPLLIRANDAS